MAGICPVLGQVAPRSYEVEINGNVYRRNRRHLLAPQCSLEEGIAILPSKGEVTVEKQDQQQREPQQSTGVVLDSDRVDARTPAGDVSESVVLCVDQSVQSPKHSDMGLKSDCYNFML